MNFDFDLENCQVELERVRDLLNIFLEFLDYECPPTPELDYKCASFAKRAGTFASVLEAAHDKTSTIIKSIDKSINDFYHKQRAEEKE